MPRAKNVSDLPFISCLCVTYGRTSWLQEVIADFLAQDYQGPKELSVLNTCSEQGLHLDCNVDLVGSVAMRNAIRPPSLGHARNMAVGASIGTHCVVWDDDDCYLPHHLSTIAAAFKDNDWIWLDKQFYAEGEEIKGIVPGACPVFAFTKKAWREVGGYPALDVGEDRQFIARVTEKFKGAKIPVEGMPSFVYRWNSGVYHVSGQGDSPTAHARMAEELQSRIKRGIEPTGEIWLQPKRRLDWKAKAEGYLRDLENRSKKNADDCAIVLLGRYGDIINLLPVARHIAESYGRPHWVVSKEFASIFDGVSYVQPFIVDLKNHQIKEAMLIAEKNFKHVICAQVWGDGWQQDRQCASYNRESWRMAGFAKQFDDKDWMPVFDKRDFKREEAFCRKINPEGKPMLVVNVRKSVSSPFKHGAELQEIIAKAFPKLLLVDVSDWDLPYIFDLLGLMERAVAVVSIDTALIHLAASCKVPIIALVNPSQWQGSEVRGEEYIRVPYDKVTLLPNLIVEAIDEAHKETPVACAVPEIRVPTDRLLFHVVERHEETNPKEKERKADAMRSWDALYANGSTIPVHVWDYPRNALTIGDARPLPFLKDVIKAGLDQASDDDIVCFTNDDNFLHPDLPAMLRYRCSIYGCCCSSRCEFHEQIPSASNKPEVFARNGRLHMGRDLFAATKRWWLSKWEEIPDHIIGASDWDLNFAAIFRLHFGIKTTRANLDHTMFPADLPRGYVSHQYHEPKWRDPKTVDTAPSQIWNRQLFATWAFLHLPELHFHPNGTI